MERANKIETQLATLTHQYPDGLTPREVEILCLLGDGFSNRQLAEHLYISIRTIERHITNIYRKIDIHNRSDAAAYAHKHRLTPPTIT